MGRRWATPRQATRPPPYLQERFRLAAGRFPSRIRAPHPPFGHPLPAGEGGDMGLFGEGNGADARHFSVSVDSAWGPASLKRIQLPPRVGGACRAKYIMNVGS